MTRLATIGAETGDLLELSTTSGASITNVATTVRSGARAYRINPSAATAYGNINVSVPAGTTIYFRTFINYTTLPSTGNNVISVGTSSNSLAKICSASSNSIRLEDSADTIIGSSATIGSGQWHELILVAKVNSAPTATNGTVEMWVNGTLIASSTSADLDTSDNTFEIARIGTSTSTTSDVYYDDIVINDSTGTTNNSQPESSKIVLLKTTSDNAVGTGWEAPQTTGSDTTDIYDAINNIPPVGVAHSDTDANNLKYIFNLASNATTNYDANVETYASKGITANDTIKIAQVVAITGSSSTTDTSGAIKLVSNPSDTGESNFVFDAANVSAGTHPTGWAFRRNSWNKPTLLFESDFESVSLADWNVSGSPVTNNTSPVYAGTNSLKIDASEYVWVSTPVSNGNSLYLRVYFRIPGSPSILHSIYAIAGTVALCRVRINTDRTMFLADSANTQIGSASSAIATDTWHKLELMAKLNTSPTSSNGTAEFRLNGATIASTTTANLGTTAIAQAQVGNMTGAAGQTEVFDSFAASTKTWPDEDSLSGALFESSFETDNFTDWVSVTGTPTRSSNHVFDGSFSMEVDALEYVRHNQTIANGASAYQRVYLRFSTAPSSQSSVFQVVTAADGFVADLALKADRTLVLLDAPGNPVGSPSAALSTNTWYCIELLTRLAASPSSSNGTIEGRLDGTSFASSSSANIGTTAQARFRVGAATASPLTTLYLDAYEMRDNTWPGSLGTSHTPVVGTAPVIRIGKRTATTRVAMVDLMGVNVEYLEGESFTSNKPILSNNIIQRASRV